MSPKDKKMLILKELEEKKILLRDYLVAGHRKPKTRREFLASGLLSAAATLVAPTLSQLVSTSAWAQSGVVCPSGAGDFPVFVHLQLAGGPALYANHLVCGPSGGAFSNYSDLGMGSQPERSPRFSSNAPIWIPGVGSKGSPMFNRAFSVLSNDQDVISNSAFVSIAAASVDDTTDDKQDMTGILQQAGAIGSPLPYLLTTGNIGATISNDRVGASARFKGAIYEEANLLSVVNLTSIENGLGYGLDGALGSFSGNTAQKLSVHQTLTKLIEDLNKYQVEQLAREPNSHESQKIFKSMVHCASEKNTANSALSNNIIDIYNPAYPGGTALAQVFARNRSGEMNRVIGNVGQIMGACLSGLSNSAVITLGGYDYHNGRTRAQADQKDEFAGDILGRILLAAKRMNKKVFVLVSADGSVSVPQNTSAGENVNWQGDLAQRGMAYMLAYDPNKAVGTAGFSLGSYSDAPFQLNHFVNDGGDYRVNSSNPIASLDANELFTSAIFLNYLNFAGQQSLIDNPKMALVKDKLVKSLPGGSLFDYYTRIKG